jgi:hypothetical protein
MKIIELKFRDENYEETLLSHLRNRVFHLTTEKALKNILRTSCIFNNKSGNFPINCSSENSLGHQRGWVCLFDFRNRSEHEIQKTRESYYDYFGPTWFRQYFKSHIKLNLAYLILSPKHYKELIANSFAHEEYKRTNKYYQYVPNTECWYPGDIPLQHIEKTILLRVYKNAPINNPHLYALHLIEYEQQRTKRSKA